MNKAAPQATARMRSDTLREFLPPGHLGFSAGTLPGDVVPLEPPALQMDVEAERVWQITRSLA